MDVLKALEHASKCSTNAYLKISAKSKLLPNTHDQPAF